MQDELLRGAGVSRPRAIAAVGGGAIAAEEGAPNDRTSFVVSAAPGVCAPSWHSHLGRVVQCLGVLWSRRSRAPISTLRRSGSCSRCPTSQQSVQERVPALVAQNCQVDATALLSWVFERGAPLSRCRRRLEHAGDGPKVSRHAVRLSRALAHHDCPLCALHGHASQALIILASVACTGVRYGHSVLGHAALPLPLPPP